MACFLQSIFNVQENKRFKTVDLFAFYVCEDGKQLLYHLCQAFLLFMRRMKILGNYVDPHRRILSDAM